MPFPKRSPEMLSPAYTTQWKDIPAAFMR
ncbi:DUF4113 domain-containing protein [Klebsiella pneumoniae]|nr:DUF4113 domain-containing protein [Klebsiella pneumoniae]MCQ9263587.1 DUF4113 domain-containing protein [Klebsiella pneumoniae]